MEAPETRMRTEMPCRSSDWTSSSAPGSRMPMTGAAQQRTAAQDQGSEAASRSTASVAVWSGRKASSNMGTA